MWRVSRWVSRVFGVSWSLISALVTLTIACGWAQTENEVPMVIFLEPSEGATIPGDADSIQIRFRLISPDNTNLMRYQPFINGLPGNEPIPIDPPSPQVDLTILWRGVKQFPDGAHIITIKVVDAKGREGMGSLTLYKGYAPTRPTAEILHPKSGSALRGQVPILVRVSDDKGVRGITVSATQKETSKTQTIYMAVGNYGRFMEVRVVWDTTAKHPETKEDLFPDGIYLLQARARDEEGNEGVSSEVLVILQNKVAQPLISQVTPGQTARGGAMPPVSLAEIPRPQTPAVPAESKLSPAENVRATQAAQTPAQVAMAVPSSQPRLTVAIPKPESSGWKVFDKLTEISQVSQTEVPPQVAMAVPSSQPRLTVAIPKPESSGQRVTGEPILQGTDLPLPQVTGAPPATSRPSLSTSYGESKLVMTYTAPYTSLSVAGEPKAAPIERGVINAPVGRVKLAAAWLPPSPRILKRASEVSEMPRAASPTPVPRLPAPEEEQKRTLRKLPRPKISLHPVHSFRYTVIAGDTLYGLAERFGISAKDLAAANGLSEDAPLRIGQRLIIPARPVTVLVDGKLAECEVPAFIRNNISVGSFRAVIEASGGIVGWDNEQKRATASLGSFNLIATIGKGALEVNGKQVPLSIAPFLLRNRTFLPLRELGKALGKETRWERGSVLIETPKR